MGFYMDMKILKKTLFKRNVGLSFYFYYTRKIEHY